MSKSDHNKSRRFEPKSDWTRPGRVIRAEKNPFGHEALVADLGLPMPAKPVYEPQPLAAWEQELLDSREDYAEMEAYDDLEDDEDYYLGDPALREDEGDDDEGTDWTPWLPCLTYSDAMQEFGSGFTIEGPAFTTKHTVNVPLKAVHYMRVYELAREIGVDTKPLIRFMRLRGEYVANHMSMVADPVAERLFCHRDTIRWALGERKTPKTPIQRMDELDAQYAARRATRPPGHRPGNNPFNYAR